MPAGRFEGAGPQPDYKQALQLHTQALQAANALISDKHPAIRVAAKEVLLDAYLGALHDIAWGAWREKERSAENWIAKATEIAQDLIKTEDGSDEYLFRLSTRALSADVGLQGKLDPAKWAQGGGAERRGTDFRRPGTRPQGRVAVAGGHVAV